MTISDTDFADLQQAVTAWPNVVVATNGLVLPLPLVREEIGDTTQHNFTAAFFPYADAVPPQFLTANLPNAFWSMYLNTVAMVDDIASAPIISKAWGQLALKKCSVDLYCAQFPDLQKTLTQLPELDARQRQDLVDSVSKQHTRLKQLVDQPPNNSWGCQITKIEDYLRWQVLGPQPTEPGGEMVLSFGWVVTPQARGDFIPQHQKPLCIHVANFLSDGRMQYAIHSVDAKQPIDGAAINRALTSLHSCRKVFDDEVTVGSFGLVKQPLDKMWLSLKLLPKSNYDFLRRVFANQPASVRGAAVRWACAFARSYYGRGHEA